MSFTPPTNRNKFVKVKTAKKRKTSSNDWLRRQLNDVYVTQAKIDGYRSRAAYKLLEIDNKFKIFRPNLKIIDLGSAPGSWCQVVTKTVKPAEITAIDLIQMEPIEGVHFICGDFLSPETNEIINNNLCGEKVDIVMSDMAANTTGHTDTDYIRTLVLYESALEFALKTLKPNGHFISKVFGGGTEHNILNIVKTNFKTIKHFKPNSSRKDSREFYLIALGYKGG